MVRACIGPLIAVALAAAAGPAAAYEYADDPPIARSGFVIGAHGGWGTFTSPRCDGCEDYFAGFAGLRLGAMIGTRFALLGGVEWGGSGDRLIVSVHVLSRWFLAERWWFDGGIGLGRVDVDEGGPRSSTFNGTSLQLGGGYDIYQGAAFAFDASLRSMYARTQVVGGERTRGDLVISLQLGVTWY